MNQVFLLSPARCDGRRAKILLNPAASFELAERIRSTGAPIGDVFAFLSGLYFRGKLAYARQFGRLSGGTASSFVITTDRGLMSLDEHVTRDDLVAFSSVDLAIGDDRFIAPLRRDAAGLAARIGTEARVVLLGSIATGKYVDTLISVFGERLMFPEEFVGRGDMSRGGLMLRQVTEGRELTYRPVLGAVRHGRRPPRLVPLSARTTGG